MFAESFNEELLLLVDDRIVNGGPAEVDPGNYFHCRYSISDEKWQKCQHNRTRGFSVAAPLCLNGDFSGKLFKK